MLVKGCINLVKKIKACRLELLNCKYECKSSHRLFTAAQSLDVHEPVAWELYLYLYAMLEGLFLVLKLHVSLTLVTQAHEIFNEPFVDNIKCLHKQICLPAVYLLHHLDNILPFNT